jgi:hypothetical protein
MVRCGGWAGGAKDQTRVEQSRTLDPGANQRFGSCGSWCWVAQVPIARAMGFDPTYGSVFFTESYPRPQNIPHYIPTQLMQGTLLKRRLIHRS